jgi:hypothetical protein
MCRHTLVVVKDPDIPAIAANPKHLANQAMGRRVVSTVDDDVAIGVQLGPLPYPHVKRRPGKPKESRLLDLKEPSQGSLLGGAVDPCTGNPLHPLQKLLIGPRDNLRLAPRQEVPLHVVDPRLHLPLVLRCPGTTRRDEKPIVLGKVTIAPLYYRIVENGPHDGGLHIVDHHFLGHPCKVLESLPMASQPRLDLLIEDHH